MSEHLHTAVEVGDVLEMTEPAGRFTTGAATERPLVLISAGIGVTPLLAMLESVAGSQPDRPVWWIHSARNGAEHAFRSEARGHLGRLGRPRARPLHAAPPRDRLGRDFDAVGRLRGEDVLALGAPTDAEYRLCGPPGFVSTVTDALVAGGVPAHRIASESFGGPAAPRPRPDAGAPRGAGERGRVLALRRGRRVGSRSSATCSRSPRPARWRWTPGAASARATAAVRASSPARCATTPSRSSRRRPAARCCAARSRRATSCSTPSPARRSRTRGTAAVPRAPARGPSSAGSASTRGRARPARAPGATSARS